MLNERVRRLERTSTCGRWIRTGTGSTPSARWSPVLSPELLASRLRLRRRESPGRVGRVKVVQVEASTPGAATARAASSSWSLSLFLAPVFTPTVLLLACWEDLNEEQVGASLVPRGRQRTGGNLKRLQSAEKPNTHLHSERVEVIWARMTYNLRSTRTAMCKSKVTAPMMHDDFGTLKNLQGGLLLSLLYTRTRRVWHRDRQRSSCTGCQLGQPGAARATLSFPSLLLLLLPHRLRPAALAVLRAGCCRPRRMVVHECTWARSGHSGPPTTSQTGSLGRGRTK